MRRLSLPVQGDELPCPPLVRALSLVVSQVDAEKAELLDKDQQLVGQQIDQVSCRRQPLSSPLSPCYTPRSMSLFLPLSFSLSLTLSL
jgi:hypothetical protein